VHFLMGSAFADLVLALPIGSLGRIGWSRQCPTKTIGASERRETRCVVGGNRGLLVPRIRGIKEPLIPFLQEFIGFVGFLGPL
jgi:hypothetical protein